MLQIRVRFAGGLESVETGTGREGEDPLHGSRVEEEGRALEEEASAVDERGAIGCGQTKSRASSTQYSLMWLKRYHCLSTESPLGGTNSGRSCAEGCQVLSISSSTVSSSESDVVFTLTHPGIEDLMSK